MNTDVTKYTDVLFAITTNCGNLEITIWKYILFIYTIGLLENKGANRCTMKRKEVIQNEKKYYAHFNTDDQNCHPSP